MNFNLFYLLLDSGLIIDDVLFSYFLTLVSHYGCLMVDIVLFK